MAEEDVLDIGEYKEELLTKMSITTSTVAYDTNLRIPYEDLSKYVKPDYNKILAVKSTCLPLEQCIQGGKFTKAARILKRRERVKKKRGELYGKPSRTLSGNQLYFQSSVEFVHSFIDIWNIYCVCSFALKRKGVSDFYMRSILMDYMCFIGVERYHNIRISPARGSIQIQGVQNPIFETAERQIHSTLNYIKKNMCIDTEYKLENRRIIIINVKCSVCPNIMKEYTNIRIDKMASLMDNLMKLQLEGKELPLNIPYDIIYVTNRYEIGSYIRIKFITPIAENFERKTTIKIFSGCKINFLGCPTLECPINIYKFLNDFIKLYKDILFYKKKENKLDLNSYISNINKNKHAWVDMVKNNLAT